MGQSPQMVVRPGVRENQKGVSLPITPTLVLVVSLNENDLLIEGQSRLTTTTTRTQH